MKRSQKESGLTVVEIAVVVSVLILLAGALVPRVTERLARSRDAARLRDLKAVRAAVEQYFVDKGEYPPADSSNIHRGWDVSHDGGFIDALVKQRYLSQAPVDPVNDETYHYRYFVYEAGAYGCRGGTPFYVLGIRNFETTEFAVGHKGYFKCNGRDWGKEFAYVMGGGSAFEN